MPSSAYQGSVDNTYVGDGSGMEQAASASVIGSDAQVTAEVASQTIGQEDAVADGFTEWDGTIP